MSRNITYSFLFLVFGFLNASRLDKVAPNLVFHGTSDTLNRITEIVSKQEKGAYLRFGDGDVNLALGVNDMLQRSDRRLSSEMREAFGINSSNVLKALPLHCKGLLSDEEGMFPGNHLGNFDWCINMLGKVKQLWGKDISDIYSAVALHFSATHNTKKCIKFLKSLKNSNCAVFVGNKNVPREVIDLLFGQKCAFVSTPSRNSYFEIDRIEKDCLQNIKKDDDYKIIITAMGCSGRVLQKRLWKKLDNVFLFDFGSLLDALCGWNTRAWIELSKFDVKSFIHLLKNKPKIIYTAALIDNHFEERKCEYIKALEAISRFGYEPYVVENCVVGPTFFNKYSTHVCYANSNNPSLKNKGVNEARSLIESLKRFNFSDDDMIIKLTGRYCFENNYFIRQVDENFDHDAFVKLDKYGQVWTGCFALRCKYFKEMLNSLDFDKMEKYMINIEREVADYVGELEKSGKKVMYLDKLHVSANIFGKGSNYNINNFVYW